jgi:ubiquinone/menaquinone biosynthesis C-methylase UbiE
MDDSIKRLRERYFGSDEHPYRTLEAEIARRLRPEHTLLDAGCGRTAPVLRKYLGSARRLVGIDLVEFTEPIDGIELYRGDVSRTQLPDRSVDLVYSRSVMEHVDDPDAVFAESHRILAPGGHWIFLTANKWDYASIIARMIPNRLHPMIVRRVEGRAEEDTFPTRYRVNDRRTIERLAQRHGFAVAGFAYLGQYPNYFMFSPLLFRIAAQYELLLRRHPSLHWLRGWILAVLQKTGSS